MSEVNRWRVDAACGIEFREIDDSGPYVLFEDYGRVTAERDAELGREAALREELDLVNLSFDSNFDAAQIARRERDALQQLLNAKDERVNVLEGLLRTSLIAMKRIYQAGYDLIIDSGGTCDTPEYMMESDPAAREIRAALKPAQEKPE